MHDPFFIIIAGPTGVGKTALVHDLVGTLPFPFEVINADMGQMYTPLTIGTAKPDYLHEPVRHHLFDVIDEPKDITVTQYRERVVSLMRELWERSVIPVLVGGSGFYLSSLFFPPLDIPIDEKDEENRLPLTPSDSPKPKAGLYRGVHEEMNRIQSLSTSDLYKLLQEIDPQRAAALHQNDRYRIERALALWYHNGIAPSACVPSFNPPGRCYWFFLSRERDELAQRINGRVEDMFDQGWVEEVAQLDSAWKAFLLTKKIIGYREIIEFLSDNSADIKQLKEAISSKTRAYAKRQFTYWRMLQKKFAQCDPEQTSVKLREINMSQEEPWKSIVNQLK